MIAPAWLFLFLAIAVIAIGVSPALPARSLLLHYLAAALGAVTLVLAIVRLAD